MTLLANTSIKLDINAAKKDAVLVTTGLHVTGATEVAIWLKASVDVGLVQSAVGDIIKLQRWAKSNMPLLAASIADPVIISMVAGGGDTDITLDGTPGLGDVVLEIGTAVTGGQKSHFLVRTVKRLTEALLENAK